MVRIRHLPVLHLMMWQCSRLVLRVHFRVSAGTLGKKGSLLSQLGAVIMGLCLSRKWEVWKPTNFLLNLTNERETHRESIISIGAKCFHQHKLCARHTEATGLLTGCGFRPNGHKTGGHLTGGTQWFFSSNSEYLYHNLPGFSGQGATLLRGFVGEVSQVEVFLETMSKLRSQLSAKGSR